MSDKLVEARGLSEQINDLLLEWIISTRFKPGQRLNETLLAEELGVSRTPVREALRSLVARGYLTVIPRRGIYAPQVDVSRLEEALDLRYLMEMYAAERGIESATREQMQKMGVLVQECESLAASRDWHQYNQYVRRDCDIHRLIIEAAGNGLLIEFYERLAVFLQIARVRLFEHRPIMTKGHEEHKLIVRAYETRDRAQLLDELGRHLTRSRRELIEIMKDTSFSSRSYAPPPQQHQQSTQRPEQSYSQANVARRSV